MQHATGFRGEIERLATDLAFVHPAPARLRVRGAPLPETFGWWFVTLLAPLSLGGLAPLAGTPAGAAGQSRRPAPSPRGRARPDGCWTRPRRTGDADAASALVIRAVTGYVADMTGRAASGLPAGAVGAHAAALGLSEIGAALEALLQECAASRYGAAGELPGSAAPTRSRAPGNCSPISPATVARPRSAGPIVGAICWPCFRSPSPALRGHNPRRRR